MSAEVKVRFRKRPSVLLFVAMVLHTAKTGHKPAYGFEWDGRDGFYTCDECGARLRFGSFVVKEPRA